MNRSIVEEYVPDDGPDKEDGNYAEDGLIAVTSLYPLLLLPRSVYFASNKNGEIGKQYPKHRIVVPPCRKVTVQQGYDSSLRPTEWALPMGKGI